MNAVDWFHGQSFHQAKAKAPKPIPQPQGIQFDRWDAEQGRWRHYHQDAAGNVTETNEIGEDL